MAEILFVVEEAPEGGNSTHVLGYSIYTEVDTWEERKTAVQDAVQSHYEEEDKPRVIRLHYLLELKKV